MAIDQSGQVTDVFVSTRRNASAARRFLDQTVGTTKVTPAEVVTDRAATQMLGRKAVSAGSWVVW